MPEGAAHCWSVYRLQDGPDGAPFYVGLSRQPAKRLVQHCGNRRGVAYARCREIMAAGRLPLLVVIAHYATKDEGLSGERASQAQYGLQLVNGLLPNMLESEKRVRYQRVYCRLRRKHGPVGDWPTSALAELRLVSKGRSL